MRKTLAACRTLIAVFFVTLVAFSSPSVKAQDTTNALQSLEPFLQKARESGATVIVVDPAQKKVVSTEDNLKNVGATSGKLRENAKRILGNAKNFFTSLGSALEKAAPGEGVSWIWKGIGLGIIALAIGYWIGRLAENWGRTTFAGVYNPNPSLRSEKIGYLLFRAFMLLVMAI